MDGPARGERIGVRQRPAHEPLSKRWFGLDWREHLPWRFKDVTVECGVIADAMPFIGRWYTDIFGAADERWLLDPMSPSKERFYDDMDVFLFRAPEEVIGLMIIHPTDWSTYYVRTLALLPAYRGQGLLAEVTRRMSDVLAGVGVERIEGETSPANVGNIIAQSRLGYLATGTTNTERWGTMIRYTKFLHAEAGKVFRRQFCHGT